MLRLNTDWELIMVNRFMCVLVLGVCLAWDSARVAEADTAMSSNADHFPLPNPKVDGAS